MGDGKGRSGIVVAVELPGVWATLDPHARRDACVGMARDALNMAARAGDAATGYDAIKHSEGGGVAALAAEVADQAQAYRQLAAALIALADDAQAAIDQGRPPYGVDIDAGLEEGVVPSSAAGKEERGDG